MKLGAGYDLHRKERGVTLQWKRDHGEGPRVPMLPTSYLQREQLVAYEIEALLKESKQ